ncbi:putative sensor with HAMP domain [Leptothrix cholodnii SP-6]|uniref:histidine kinase n=1 Tax=Leptothrix cholodnii (strain ATCC 51168 / LMG 8142 / SP-6) TaxID=395495 RepID=B1XXQ1_LEPCP|nr:HAMP domain-containing protein [Leptothrix cholodnii]ACB36370.1 putative sensor with HAMP domain [Leptothrix cholodnii SP-6]
MSQRPEPAGMAVDARTDGAALPLRKSLRAKGWIATLALLGYLLGALAFVAVERARLFDNIETLQQLARHEKALALTEAAVSAAVLDLQHASEGEAGEPALPSDFALYMENCARLFATLDEFDPRYAGLERAINRSYGRLQAAPVRAHWLDLREVLTRTAGDFDLRRLRLAEQRDALTLAYRQRYDAVTRDSLLLSLLGIALFGSVAAWFFARLARDIRRLELHARQIVHGARGVDLPVARQDELGHLMHAVNRLSADLDAREKQIELEGLRRSHQDKMMALGALAAGVAHEVNNPLAVIAGVAQELDALDADAPPARIGEAARLILAQTQRAARAARNLAELAAPQPTEFDWLDLNAMVRRVLQLMAYDKRYRAIRFDADLAGDVPAVLAPAEAVQQVLMQTLAMGCDALIGGPATPGGPGSNQPEPVRVRTRGVAAAVEVRFMFPVPLDLARPQHQRLLLSSRAILEPMRGHLAIGQDEASGLCITLTLAADSGGP